MKLNDVFKLNLQFKGGAKLFDRIMNRYGIPKDEADTFKESVKVVSSSESGGIKEHYYRIYNSDVLTLHNMTGSPISGVVQYVNVSTNKGDTLEYLYIKDWIDSVIAFRFPDVQTNLWGSYDGYNPKNYVEIKGDFFERILNILKLINENVTLEQVKEQYWSDIQEISKEEYESLITYKG